MIKINQLKLPVGHSQKDLEDKIRKTLRIPSKETFHYEVMRRSLDARKKPSLFLCILHLCNDPSGKQHRKKNCISLPSAL